MSSATLIGNAIFLCEKEKHSNSKQTAEIFS